MKPTKIYVNRKNRTYKKLLKLLELEKSLLENGVDSDGKDFLVVDVDKSLIISKLTSMGKTQMITKNLKGVKK